MQVSISLAPDSGQWSIKLAWGPKDAETVRSFNAARLDFTPWIGPGSDGMPLPDDPDHDILSGTAAGLQERTARVAGLGGTPLKDHDLLLYGRLLFTSVLAPVWNTVVEASQGELIELALRLPSDPPLQTVLWELLHDGSDFLVTHKVVDVAITRRLPGPATTPDPITAPARVLFAIGADLSDPAVQPGAEFLGLMRELERSGFRIASYIVERANAARLIDAVKEFKPDVVHFIAHGKLNSAGVPGLMMRPEQDGPDKPAQHITADTLYACVSAGEKMPPIVVLAACESGAVSAVHGMPLAEGLVRKGVPVVIAMAGKVTDQACRLFTRTFGTALAGGGSLLKAAADARLAAYRRGSGPPCRTVDWALPSVFLADNVRHDYQPVAVSGGAPVSERIQGYGFTEGPVFCGRSRFFGLYDELMSSGPLNVLAIYSPGDTGGLGKTRILREYGTRALLDGHIPCVVGLAGLKRPADPRRFAEALLWAIVEARRLFDLPPPSAVPELLKLLCSPDEPPPVAGLPWRTWRTTTTGELARHRQANQPLDRDSLAAAIVADLADLLEDARSGEDPRIGPEGRAVVLLDTVEEWGDTVDLLTPGILNKYGLGDEDESVPVVMTFRAGVGAHDALFEKLIELADREQWLKAAKLEPLAEGNEEALAYRWILLNANPLVAPPVSERVYTVIKQDGQWRDWLGLVTKRVPANFSDVSFYGAVQLLFEKDELAEGNDNAALALQLGLRP
jgi:CHAT domain